VDACVHIRRLKQLAPLKIVMGNVNTYLLSDGNPDRVRKHGEGCLKAGSGILAPACGISPKTPVENIRSLSEAVAGWADDGHD
jgi:uroporphyrinogen-III decarboxylase